MIVFTEIPNNQFTYDVWDLSKYEGAHIIAVHPGEKGELPLNLTEDFHSACSPQISYDGKNMLFAAKKNAENPWQIWEMKLSNKKTRQITSFPENCISPDYLPGNRFVFSRLLTDDKVGTNYTIFSGNLDGSNISQITFDPRSHGALSVIDDGRILTLSKQEYPEKGKCKLLVLRPDGTKLELFYKSDPDEKIVSPAIEMNGKIFFVETDNSKGGQLISLDYNLPLHSREVITEGLPGEFAGVSGFNKTELLVCYKKPNNRDFLLGVYNPEDQKFSELYSHDGYSIVKGVQVKAYQRPKNLPSEVQMQEKSGLLMCQDINFTGIESLKDAGILKADKIEILGIDSTLGIINVEEDGSFYIKVEADVPFRIQTVSKDGDIIHGPGDWYYIRSNERRACVGCHTGPEIAPFNRQPLAVREAPVIIKENDELKMNAESKDYEHE
ncbi:MAG: hypothetical protein JW731_12045 [Bacteroidales bacterium]|nr:hypothetical protein [Bacteroidales bacterium]